MTLSRFVRLTAILLIPAMFSNNLAFAAKNPVDPASVKAKLQSRGVGHGVRVTMADNTEAKGLIVWNQPKFLNYAAEQLCRGLLHKCQCWHRPCANLPPRLGIPSPQEEAWVVDVL